MNDRLVEEYPAQELFLQQYFKDHKSKTNQRLHVIGIGLAILIALHALFTFDFLQMIYVPIFGFGFAWTGHYLFEANKPYTKPDQILYGIKANLMIIFQIIMKKRRF